MAVDLSVPISVVDDYNTMVRSSEICQTTRIRDVDAAPDGTAALVKMRDRKYGLVISD